MLRPSPRRAAAPADAPRRSTRPWVAFCARCGSPPARVGAVAPAPVFSRVCARCSMGLVLRSPDDAAPRAGEPFLVVDRGLTVCAVSRSAEAVLGVTEPFAIGRPVGDLLADEPAEPYAGGLLMLVRRAVLDGGRAGTCHARPALDDGPALELRVGPCGPPRAAVVVLGD